jgi:hypothetical protein
MTLAASPQPPPVLPSDKGKITGWHVLFAVVTFFVLIIGVDAFFIVFKHHFIVGDFIITIAVFIVIVIQYLLLFLVIACLVFISTF